MFSSNLSTTIQEIVLFWVVKFDIDSVCVVVMRKSDEKLKTNIDWSCSSMLNIHNLDRTEHWSSWFPFLDVIFLIFLNIFRAFEFFGIEYHRMCFVKESIFSFDYLVLPSNRSVFVLCLHAVNIRNKKSNIFLEHINYRKKM